MKRSVKESNVSSGQAAGSRTAVGYIRVSTDMQAADGLSLEAQKHAIQAYCTLNGLRLAKICQDVESGGKRIGLDLLRRWRPKPTL